MLSFGVLPRRSSCFPRKPENLRTALCLFVRAYDRFGAAKVRFRVLSPLSRPPFSLLNSLTVRLDAPIIGFPLDYYA